MIRTWSIADHGNSRSCHADPGFPGNHAAVARAGFRRPGAWTARRDRRAGRKFALSDEERPEMLPSGFQAKFTNRVAWAATHLNKANAINHGLVVVATSSLAEESSSLPPASRSPSPCSPSFRSTKYSRAATRPPNRWKRRQNSTTVTPAEAIEAAVSSVRQAVSSELLDRIKSSPPDFFERLVVDLLLAMGYGGSRRDAGSAVGRSGDGGIDGVIKEDRLGLDAVYIQAKRWEGPVGRPVVQMFAVAWMGKATKGVLITTSSFTNDARDYVRLSANELSCRWRRNSRTCS